MLEDVAGELETIRAEAPELRIEGVGAFGGARPRSAHALVASDPALSALREAVRAAMVDAASQEQGPFGLRGRRHEPRVSLSRGLAATLRGLDLPCSSNHGAGNRRYFPRRVLERAGRLLQERLHRAVLCCDHDRARLKGEA